MVVEKKEAYEKLLTLCKQYENDFPLFKQILKKLKKIEIEQMKEMKKNEKKLKKIEIEQMKEMKKNEKKLKKIEIEQLKKNEKKLKKEEMKKIKKNEKLTVIGKKRILTKMLKKEERTFFDCYDDIKQLLPKKHHINDICKYFKADIENGLKKFEKELYVISDLYLYDIEGSGKFKDGFRSKLLQAKYTLYEKAFRVIQIIQEGLFWFMCKVDPKKAVHKFLEFSIDNDSKNNNINTLEGVYYYDEDNFISITTPSSNYQFLKNITCKSNLLFKRNLEDVMVYLTNVDPEFSSRIAYFNMKAMDYDIKHKNIYLYAPDNKNIKKMWWVWSEECVESHINDLDFVTFTSDYKYQLYNGKRFDREINLLRQE